MSAIRSPLAKVHHDEIWPTYRPAHTRTTSAEIERFATILEQAETEIVAIVMEVLNGDTRVAYPAEFARTLGPSVWSLTKVLIGSVETGGWPVGVPSKRLENMGRSVESFGTVEGLLRTAQGFSKVTFAVLLRAYHSAYLAVVCESSIDWDAARRYRDAIDRFFDCLRQADDKVKFPHRRSQAAAGRFSPAAKRLQPLGVPRDDGSGTAVVFLDASGRLEWANHAAVRLFGLGAALREPPDRRPSVPGQLGCLKREIEAFSKSSTAEFILVWPLETALGRCDCSAHFVHRTATETSNAGVTIAIRALDQGIHFNSGRGEKGSGASGRGPLPRVLNATA